MSSPNQLASDQDAIQGLWKVVSYISRGRPVLSGSTHYQFEGNRVKEITPSLVDGGVWATFELDPSAQPKRLTVTYHLLGKDGKAASRIHHKVYDLDGDDLRICPPSVWGIYPDVISEKEHSVITLVRDTGPPPTTKQRSGKEPIHDPILGTLTWNDDLDEWDTRLTLKTDLEIEYHLDPGEEQDMKVVESGRQFFAWLQENEHAARRYAASRLLDIHNDNWNNGKQISARTFAERMTLVEAGVRPDGQAELFYRDGDLFRGHCIIVSVSADREFTDANIAG